MANFTIELKKIANKKVVQNALSNYPIFDESHRKELNDKIIAHYYNYEIGHETIDMFAFQLGVKMREIMPYYNELYKSAAQKFDILDQFDVKSESTQTTDQTGSNSSAATGSTISIATQSSVGDNTAKSRAIASDMPQTRLSSDENYATGAQDSISSGVTSSKSDANNRDSSESKSEVTSRAKGNSNSISRSYGRQSSAPALIMEFRSAILNIDMMIIDELSDLFMGLWATNDNIFSN